MEGRYRFSMVVVVLKEHATCDELGILGRTKARRESTRRLVDAVRRLEQHR